MITDPSGLTTFRLEMGYRDVYCANYFGDAHGTTPKPASPLRERHPGRDEICRRDGPHNPWSPTPQQGQRGNFSSDCWSRSAVSLQPSLSRSTIRSGSPASLRPDSTVFGIPGAVQASQAGGMDGGTRSSILGNRNSNGPDSG